MKKVKMLAILLMIGIIAVSCKKEEGPQGPTGPAGPAGANGNANVTIYGFPGDTLTTTFTALNFYLPITPGMADSSMILPYYFTNSFWYLAGGLGYGGNYLTRFGIEIAVTTTTRVFIGVFDPDATPYSGMDIIWDSIKIVVIPANIFKKTPIDKVDFKDYQSVKSYYTER